MPVYNVTLNKDSSFEDYEKAKASAQQNGGVIQHEYNIIKGFTVEYSGAHTDLFESSDGIHVEQDSEVRTQ
ncbi:hypothetical protein N7492_007432 [Penicillium capsulatum]|uniref:Inhibitor I9 domain-containing protein n=1 Tax=Penicillium capsulatum TaxID=69766 RepID=A0A9W9I556_9EURO|nr:hypothetical protein N7492_007432 [Penicillium capsulatum]KAJ6117268.1 hypothetical protein N7512_006993 [Penicillium capsulatum]